MKRVLITGGTGYFARGMVRALLRANDGVHICLYSRGEAAQAAMRAETQDPDERLHWFIGDVRDRERLCRAMQGCDVVLHAAALKRVEVGEYNPGEMVKTNVTGTVNVIEAAHEAGVERVVYLSSDKACQPRNCYGATKLTAEKLVIAANNASGAHGPRFSVTRYGNVAGSTGSVIPQWRAALDAGRRPIITDPEATRFWMTLDQAVQLVYDAATRASSGEIIVPSLPAYRLGDLSAAMGIVELDTVGLGRGEKLHERMREDGPDSSQVERMTVQEIREALANV